jgi:hypothetical protein
MVLCNFPYTIGNFVNLLGYQVTSDNLLSWFLWILNKKSAKCFFFRTFALFFRIFSIELKMGGHWSPGHLLFN